jgi:hypothetical protein
MTTIASPFIQSANFVLSFADLAQQVRFEQPAAEAAFRGLMGVQSTQTNVPDEADPTIPRIVFHGPHKALQISQISCQIDMSFERSDLPISEQIEVIAKNARAFFDRALTFRNAEAFRSTGLVIEINVPTRIGTTDSLQHLFDRFIKFPQIGEIASLQTSIGFKYREYFVSITTNTYEKRQFHAPINPSKVTFFNLEHAQLLDQGISYKVDVNNRSRAASENLGAEAPEALVATMKDFLSTYLAEISGVKF